MLGRLRPKDSNLTQAELASYKAGYCGLCRSLHQQGGRLSSLTLSYDLTFLAHLDLIHSPRSARLEVTPCTAVFWKKVDSLNVAPKIAALGLALAHLKLEDDRRDEGSLKARVGLRLLQPEATRALETLEAANFPLATFEQYRQQQQQVERGPLEIGPGRLSVAAAPSGRFSREVFRWISQGWSISPANVLKWSRFGELVGEAVYIADALEDRTRDARHGSFNPLLALSPAQLEALRPELRSRAQALLQAWEEFPARGEAWPALSSSVEQLSGRLRLSQPCQEAATHPLRRLRNRQAHAAYCRRHEYYCVEELIEGVLALCWYAGASRREREMERVHGDLLKDSRQNPEPEESEPPPPFQTGEYTCPNCDTHPMGCHVIGQAGLFHCPKCSGVWLQGGHVPELRQHEATEKFIGFPQTSVPPVHPPGTRRCPVDGKKLELTRTHGLTVDACPTCKGWYLDAGELRSLL